MVKPRPFTLPVMLTRLFSFIILSACALGLFACSQGAGDGAHQTQATQPMNVVLFVIDTLRADRLGCYGNEAQPSTAIDAFAKSGILFENAKAPSPYTATSHASLFSSTYPATHGVWNRVKIPGAGKNKAFPTLSENADTLAEVLQRNGYQTAAIADGGFLTDRRGLAQGFELFDSKTLWVKNRMNRALDWLQNERDETRPFFLFLHTYEVHYPYLPEPKYVERFANGYQGPIRDAVEEARVFLADNPVQNPIGDIQRKFFKPFFDNDKLTPRDKDFIFALYDAEIAMTDDETARLFAFLNDSGLKGNTLVIITSDHGEEFWEHGRFGHNQIYEEVLAIPLIVQVPGGPEGIRRADPAELVDVMPSILSLLQIEPPAAAIGRDLDWANAKAQPKSRATIAQANLPKVQTSWTEGAEKIMFEGPLRETAHLFQLDNDPTEQSNLAHDSDMAEFVHGKKRIVESWLQSCVSRRVELGLEPGINSIHQFTPEQARELEALGYVGGD